MADRILVILPTYNERDNIVAIVGAIQEQLSQADIWIVDDNSPDGTGALADRLAQNDSRISVIHRAGKLGLGTAYVQAFGRAMREGYVCILQMDADFSHDPAYLPSLLHSLEDADLVIGSRYVKGGGTENWSTGRQWISRVGNHVARLGLGVRVHDATGGFRAFRTETLKRINFDNLNLRGYGFQIEVVYQVERLGMTVREVPIVFVERAAGQSKMSRAIVLEAVLYIARRRLGMLFSTVFHRGGRRSSHERRDR